MVHRIAMVDGIRIPGVIRVPPVVAPAAPSEGEPAVPEPGVEGVPWAPEGVTPGEPGAVVGGVVPPESEGDRQPPPAHPPPAPVYGVVVRVDPAVEVVAPVPAASGSGIVVSRIRIDVVAVTQPDAVEHFRHRGGSPRAKGGRPVGEPDADAVPDGCAHREGQGGLLGKLLSRRRARVPGQPCHRHHRRTTDDRAHDPLPRLQDIMGNLKQKPCHRNSPMPEPLRGRGTSHSRDEAGTGMGRSPAYGPRDRNHHSIIPRTSTSRKGARTITSLKPVPVRSSFVRRTSALHGARSGSHATRQSLVSARHPR